MRRRKIEREKEQHQHQTRTSETIDRLFGQLLPMKKYSITETMRGKQHLAAITAPTFVSSNAFMFANNPAANMEVYTTYGRDLA